MDKKNNLLQQIEVLEQHLKDLKSKYEAVLNELQTLSKPKKLKPWKDCSLGERFTMYMLANGLVELTEDIKEDLIKHLASMRFVDFLLENDKETAKLIADLIEDIAKMDIDKIIKVDVDTYKKLKSL